jgi:GNAT superfamily N-acetyltransferase
MSLNYEIVPYQPDLKRQVIELQTHLWSPDLSLNASYFEWKFERNPYVKKPLIYLAMSHGKAIGMRGFFGVQWECGATNQRFTNLYADDMVIAPEHRNRGLMAKIMTSAFNDLATSGYNYAFNLSAGSATLRSSLSMGWRSAGWVRPMHRRSWPTVLQRGVLRRIKKLSVFSDKLSSFASRQLARSRYALENNSLENTYLKQINRTIARTPSITVEYAPRCAAMAELVSRIGNAGRIRHVRDSEYFRWRFQNPLSRYRYIFWEQDRLEGYLVLQEYTSEYFNREVVNIVNWEASNATIQEGLLKAALAIFSKGRELVIWSATLPEPTIALLCKIGFRFLTPPTDVTCFPTAILVRPIAGFHLGGEWMLGDRLLLDLASWDLQMLYSMLG